MEDHLDLVHNQQKLLLCHEKPIKFDFAHFHFLSWLSKLDRSQAKGSQGCDNEANRSAIVRNHDWNFTSFPLFAF